MSKELLGTEEIQTIEAEMLLKFSKYCCSHDLKFTLIGGTLLGAVRHGGFIPWDDDIDIGMPRSDYNTLARSIESFQEETGLLLSGIYTIPIDSTPVIKVLNPKVAAKESADTRESFLWIDVMPIDSLPSSDTEYSRLILKANFWRHALGYLATTSQSSQSKIKRILKRIGSPIRNNKVIYNFLATIVGRKLNSIALVYSEDTTDYAGVITWGIYGKGERQLRCEMEPYDTMLFMNMEMPTMKCWDKYLHDIYGDYLVLPPEEDRHTHGIKAWLTI